MVSGAQLEETVYDQYHLHFALKILLASHFYQLNQDTYLRPLDSYIYFSISLGAVSSCLHHCPHKISRQLNKSLSFNCCISSDVLPIHWLWQLGCSLHSVYYFVI